MKKSATRNLWTNSFAGFVFLFLFAILFFSVDVKAQPPCNGVPQVGNIIAFQNPVCPGANFVLLYNPTQSGITYQWFSSPDGNVYNPIPGAVQQQLQTSILQPIFFELRIRCTQSGQTAFTQPILINIIQPVIQYPSQSVTLNNGESTHPDNTGYVSFETTCCQGSVTYSDAVSSTCCQTVITRTWTIVDCQGEGIQFVQTITVLLDVSAPVITCSPLPPGGCNTTPTPDPTTVTVVDQCPGTLSVASSEAAGPGCTVVTTFTWTATDQCGHSSTCTQTYSRVVDLVPPVIVCPAPVALPCNVTPTPSSGLISATDNCGTPEITILSSGSSTDGCLVTYTFTWRAIDGCGNFADCNQILTSVHDLVPPIINCGGPISLPCSTTPSPSPEFISYQDDCGLPTLTFQGSSSSTAACTTTTVFTWRATDACGNFTECNQIYTSVFDEIAPTIQCPGPISLPCNTSPVPDPSLILAQDNCGIPNIMLLGVSSSMNGCLKTFILTWKATDACGNFAVCDQIYTSIFDNIDPFIECPEPVTLPCNTTPVPDPSSISIADNCGTPTLTLMGTDVSTTGCLKIFELTWRATDGCGNFSECTQVYFSDFDLIPPVIVCPEPDTLCNVTPSPNASQISATDNCGFVDITFVGATTSTVGCITIHNYTWKATDDCGNFSTCVQVIYAINDLLDPEIFNCPNTQSVPNDEGQCGAIVTWTPPTATDNCGLLSFTSTHAPNTFFPVGKTTVIYTAVDLCGHIKICKFDIFVDDLEPPWNMHCPGVIIKDTDEGECSAIVTWNATATDNCGGVIIDSEPESGSVFPVGVTPVVVTATDLYGNTWTCSFDVHINDNEKPVFENCPDDITKVVNPGFCIAAVDWPDIIVTDNCELESVVLVPNFNGIFPVGVHNLTYTATDIHGNVQTCKFRVTVIDDTPPVINNCPANIVVNTEPGLCRAQVSWVAPTAVDNCGVLSLTCNFNSGDDFPAGEYVVIYTATDINGNVSICSFIIDVDDIEKPFILSHDIVTCEPIVFYNFVIGDNCDIDRFSYNPPSGSVFPIGTTTVYAEAWDIHNNMTFRFFDVTVLALPSPIDSVKASHYEVCLGDSVTLTAYFDTLGAGGKIKLYEGACGGANVIDSSDVVDNVWTIRILPGPNAGTHSYNIRIEGACDTTECVPVTLDVKECPPVAKLNLKLFLQGFYTGGGLMNNSGTGGLLNKLGISPNPLDVDTVYVSAIKVIGNTYTIYSTQKGILKTNGDVSIEFDAADVPSGSYYLRVKHRNSVETWSKNEVLLSGTTTYSFISSASQAFGDNEIATFDNFGYAIYTGDINHDGSVDASDFLQLDPVIQNGDGGYLVEDLNGDGSVDATDFLMLDPNIQNGVGASTP